MSETKRVAVQQGEVVKIKSERVHVTSTRDGGLYGHAETHCDESGCSGDEVFWGALGALGFWAAEAGVRDMVDAGEFLAEVKRLGGTLAGAEDWLDACVASAVGRDGDTAESLAWLCVDDELSNLDPEVPEQAARIAKLRANLAASMAVAQ